MSDVSTHSHTLAVHALALAAVAVALVLVSPGLASASGPNGTLIGVLTDSATHLPVAGATVIIASTYLPWTFQAAANATGVYVISVPNGQYTVTVWAAAYNQNSTTVVVGSGMATWNNMSLDPAPSRSVQVEGYVTDSISGLPIDSGQIVAAPPPYFGSVYENASALNGSGYFAMNLTSGWYEFSSTGNGGYEPYSSYIYYFSGGTVQWLNISLVPAPLVAWINGTVYDSYTDAAIAGANLTASLSGLQLAPATANATGDYSLEAPNGTIEVTADAPGYAPGTATVYVYGSGTYSADLYLTPLATGIQGFIVNGLTGAGVAGATVTVEPLFSSGYANAAASNGTGYYAVHLPESDYWVTVTAPRFTSASSYEYLYSSGSEWLNLTLWPIVSTLQGFLTDAATGAPISGLYVSVRDPRSGFYATAVSNASGFYTFTLPPSPADSLTVSGSSPYAGAVAYPDVRPYETTWENLTIARLSVPITANVTDAVTGLPISGASVTANWAYGYDWNTTNASGLSTVLVPNGVPLYLYVWASGYLSGYLAVGALGGPYAVHIALFPNLPTNVTVEGYVWDGTTGYGLWDAYVQATGYGNSAPWTYTDTSGFYQLSAVAQPQTVEATYWGYGAGFGPIAPAAAGTIWLNFTLYPDSTTPQILDFTATPSTYVQPYRPAALHADVNESDLMGQQIALYRMESASGGVGNFASLGQIPSANVTAVPTTPGNSSIGSSWDTRTPILQLSDGTQSTWWPTYALSSVFQDAVWGYFDNATLAAPVWSYAAFDLRSGSLLYVYTYGDGYIDPVDQPTATFTPQTSTLSLNLSTAAIVGYGTLNGPTFRLDSVQASLSPTVPTGQYAAVLQVWDGADNTAQAAVLLSVAPDPTPPVARAGPSQTVDQHATVTFNGTASTDSVGISSYTWTFMDGSLQILHGAIATYTFADAGSYRVTLTVTDVAGNSATNSLTVTVLDTTAPIVSLVSPGAGATVSGSIAVSATASDNVGVVRVEFLVDGVPIGNATGAAFTVTLDTRTLGNGNHTLEAIAFDAAGNSASSTRTIVVANVATGILPSGLGFDLLLLVLVVIAAAVIGVVLVLRRRSARPPNGPVAPPMPPPPGTPPPPEQGSGAP